MAIGLVQPSASVRFPFKTLDELGSKLVVNTCKLVFSKEYNNSEFLRIFHPQGFQNGGAIFWESLLQVMDTKSYLVVDNLDQLANTLLKTTPQMCYVGFQYAEAKNLFEGKNCRLKMFPSDIELGYEMNVYYHMVKDLNMLLAPVMRTASLFAFEEYAKVKYYTSKTFPICDISDRTIPWAPIILKKVIWSFLTILLIGFGLALVSFFCEFMKDMRNCDDNGCIVYSRNLYAHV